MVCLGFEPGPAGWYAQTKPRRYFLILTYNSSQALFMIKPPCFYCITMPACITYLHGRKYYIPLSHSFENTCLLYLVDFFLRNKSLIFCVAMSKIFVSHVRQRSIVRIQSLAILIHSQYRHPCLFYYSHDSIEI